MKLFVIYNQEYVLDIYGDGPLKNKLLVMIQEYELDDYINIYSSNKDIEKLYTEYDVYLNTSIYEGFGLTTLEALECGLPVIGFDIPANRNLIVNHKTGKIIKCYDIDEYAQILLKMIKEKDLLKQYQKNIPKSIKKFNKESIIKEWINIIEK